MQPQSTVQSSNSQFDQQYRISFQKIDQWKKYLAENGFVVVKNFISKQQCQKYMDEVWDVMEKLSLNKLSRKDIESQKNKDNYPSNHRGGLMQYIGHAKFQWDLRKKVKPIFAKLWGTQNLKSSFDGVCFSNGLLNFQHKPQNQGLHVDQPPIKNKLWSYQGIMALSDAATQGGGFVCVPKSHIYFSEYFKPRGSQTRISAYSIPKQDIYSQPLCNYIKVNVQAGDFTLFDSRTFHCGSTPRDQNLRVATYICMMPQKMVPPLVVQKRKKAFKQRFNSGHHCGDGFRTFSKIPRNGPKDKEQHQKFCKIISQINQQGIEQLDNDKQILELI